MDLTIEVLEPLIARAIQGGLAGCFQLSASGLSVMPSFSIEPPFGLGVCTVHSRGHEQYGHEYGLAFHPWLEHAITNHGSGDVGDNYDAFMLMTPLWKRLQPKGHSTA